MQHFRDPEDIYFADSGAFSHIGELSPEAVEALQDKDLGSAQEILAVCRRERLQILTYRDAAYPRRLQNIPDPPIVLYYKGQLPQLDATAAIAVVGTRKASLYGLTTAKRMGYQLGRCGGIVVSGMAQGIDAMAMAGALTAGQPVVGVLGCGADILYPPSNKALFRDTEEFGCILSEFPPGTAPARWTFPKRNRIISGLSSGVLVVEAPEKSGALITARLAAEQGRDVFVVPGNIDMPSFVGSNALLRDGAAVASSGWDILSEYQSLYPEKLHRENEPVHQRAYPDEVPKVAEPEKKKHLKKELGTDPIDKGPSEPYSDVDETKLTADERAVVAVLRGGERLVDEVIAETGLTTGKLLAVMTMLELKGVIRRLPGKRMILK
ncbi:MAG: DNA-processing protein DprA [Eubacteriales bacterium]|nr:DNA-processing protein DprA [Eubacteriales bacterium]